MKNLIVITIMLLTAQVQAKTIVCQVDATFVAGYPTKPQSRVESFEIRVPYEPAPDGTMTFTRNLLAVNFA